MSTTVESEWAHVSFVGREADGVGISSRRTPKGIAEIVNGLVRGIFFLHWDDRRWLIRAATWDLAREQANTILERKDTT